MTRHTIPRQHAVPYHKTALDKHRRYPTTAHNTRHHNPTAATRHHTTQRNATQYDQQQKQHKPRHGTASARHRRTPPNATQRNSTAHTTTQRNATTTLRRTTQRPPTRCDKATRIRNAAPQTTIKKTATRRDLTPHLMCRSTSTWLLLTDDKERHLYRAIQQANKIPETPTPRARGMPPTNPVRCTHACDNTRRKNGRCTYRRSLHTHIRGTQEDHTRNANTGHDGAGAPGRRRPGETRNAEHAINNHPRGDTTPDRPQ